MRIGLVARRQGTVIDNSGSLLDFSKFKMRLRSNSTLRDQLSMFSFSLQLLKTHLRRKMMYMLSKSNSSVLKGDLSKKKAMISGIITLRMRVRQSVNQLY